MSIVLLIILGGGDSTCIGWRLRLSKLSQKSKKWWTALDGGNDEADDDGCGMWDVGCGRTRTAKRRSESESATNFLII